MVMHIQPYLQVRNLGGGISCPFLKIETSALILVKKCPDCDYLSLKFSIQNVVLRVFWRNIPKYFPVGPFFMFF